MFLKTYTELPMDFEQVCAAMRQCPTRWLDSLAANAGRDGQRMLVEVGLEVGGHAIDPPTYLTVGEPVLLDHVASVPLRLGVEGHEALFPSLDGSLDAAWLGAGRTYLALSLQYQLSFEVVSRVADRTLLHRVAETVAQRLLEGISERLKAQLAPKVRPNTNGTTAVAPAPGDSGESIRRGIPPIARSRY